MFAADGLMDALIFGRRSTGLVMIIASGRGFVRGWRGERRWVGFGGLCTFRFVPLPWFLFAGESVGPADVMSCFSSVCLLYCCTSFLELLVRFFRGAESIHRTGCKMSVG